MLRWKSSLKPAAAASGGITLEGSAENEGHTGYNSPYNISVSYPAVSANDILLAIISTERRVDFNGTPPTGWTKVIETDGDNAFNSTQAVYWKRATGSAAATSETWSSIVNAAQFYYAWVGAYSGCVTSVSPIDASAGSYQGYGTSWSQSITTQSNNAMILAVAGTANNTHTFVWSDGTELIDKVYQSTATVSINEKIESTAGATTRSGTISASQSGTMTAVALKDSAAGPAGDALILNGVTNNLTGGVETSMRTDGSSTVYGGYAIGNMNFRDASKDGSWTDDGFGCIWDQSTDGSNWQTLLGSTSGTFYIYEQGTSTLIFSFAWSGEGNWSGTNHRYGTTSLDFTGTVPADATRIDVYHVKD